MKKTYIVPSAKIVKLQITPLLQNSVQGVIEETPTETQYSLELDDLGPMEKGQSEY